MAQDYNLYWLHSQVKEGKEFEFFYFWEYMGFEATGKHAFSLWHKSPFTIEEFTYPTMQHYMMAHKALIFDDQAQFKRIMAASTPMEAQFLGSEIADFDIEHWGEQRYDITKMGIIHKFNQYPLFAEQLLQTGDKVLVEASLTDTLWRGEREDSDDPAVIYDAWSSINFYGFALMGARDFLREFGHFEPIEIPMLLPWKKFPDDAETIFKEGTARDYLRQFCKYYNSLSERDKTICKLTHPIPYDWYDMYDECDFLKLCEIHSRNI